MAGFEEVLTVTDLADAAELIVATLAPRPAAVWSIQDGERQLLAGTQTDAAGATATGLCGLTIEITADVDAALLAAAAALVASASDRLTIEDRARRSRRRLADSERIGMLGTYSWDRRTGELEWTDGLFRIYGHEPGALELSYERFLEHVHPDDRDAVQRAHRRSLETGEPFEMEERIVRPDGEVRTLVSIGEVITDDAGEPTGIVGVCRDVTEQRAAEHQVADADLRRRQALELNDNVIQGLVSMLWQLQDDPSQIRPTAEATLTAARRMVDDLLRADDRDVSELIRRAPIELSTPLTEEPPPPPAPATPLSTTVRVLLADDLPALRTMLRMTLTRREGIEVVAEAGDGLEAIELVERHRPDVVVMDLSMPRLDGLVATRRIRAVSPTTRVIVLSGYPSDRMAADALAAGAECYLEKTSDLEELCAVVIRRPAAH